MEDFVVLSSKNEKQKVHLLCAVLLLITHHLPSGAGGGKKKNIYAFMEVNESMNSKTKLARFIVASVYAHFVLYCAVREL